MTPDLPTDRELATLQEENDRLRGENALLKEGIRQGERLRKRMVALVAELKETRRLLQASADRTRQVLDGLDDLLFVVDPGGVIRATNRRASETLGYAAGELDGRRIGEALATDERGEDLFGEFSRFTALLAQGAARDLRAVCLAKDRSEVPVLVSGADLRDGRSVILAARDVRDSQLLRVLRDSRSQLLHTAKLASLGELSAGFAHELNNPLMFVLGFAERIAAAVERPGELSRERLALYAREVAAGAERMKAIIGHFMELSRQPDAALEPLELDAVIDSSFALFGEQLRLRSIDVRRERERVHVLGDRLRLEQAFVNLISNASDALDGKADGPRAITVRTRGAGDHAVVELEDNGAGVAPGALERVFEPFFTTKGPGRGTGLGLWIVHRIVAEHGGTVTASSVPGLRTVFSVRLPRAPGRPQ